MKTYCRVIPGTMTNRLVLFWLMTSHDLMLMSGAHCPLPISKCLCEAQSQPWISTDSSPYSISHCQPVNCSPQSTIRSSSQNLIRSSWHSHTTCGFCSAGSVFCLPAKDCQLSVYQLRTNVGFSTLDNSSHWKFSHQQEFSVFISANLIVVLKRCYLQSTHTKKYSRLEEWPEEMGSHTSVKTRNSYCTSTTVACVQQL